MCRVYRINENTKSNLGGRKLTYLTSTNIRINIRINAFSVIPWGNRKGISIGKIQMLDGLVSTHWSNFPARFDPNAEIIFLASFASRGLSIMILQSGFKNLSLIMSLAGSVPHQMAVPVPSISCCVLKHHNLFYQIHNALAFNQDTCCHLALCLQLLPFRWTNSEPMEICSPVKFQS